MMGNTISKHSRLHIFHVLPIFFKSFRNNSLKYSPASSLLNNHNHPRIPELVMENVVYVEKRFESGKRMYSGE